MTILKSTSVVIDEYVFSDVSVWRSGRRRGGGVRALCSELYTSDVSAGQVGIGRIFRDKWCRCINGAGWIVVLVQPRLCNDPDFLDRHFGYSHLHPPATSRAGG